MLVQDPSFDSPSVNSAKEFAMTHLAHATSTSAATTRKHAQAAVPSAAALETEEKARPLAGMLLAAGMAALLVTADQVINSWTDGHMLAAWVALWTVTFAALAILATPLRKISNTGAAWLNAYLQASKERREEAQMWELARHDHRVMAEIRLASIRQTQG
jgi:hypothetical protein